MPWHPAAALFVALCMLAGGPSAVFSLDTYRVYGSLIWVVADLATGAAALLVVLAGFLGGLASYFACVVEYRGIGRWIAAAAPWWANDACPDAFREE